MSDYPRIPLRGVQVEDLEWLAGSWIGTVGGEPVEEIWSRPRGGTMMGMFRWLRDGKPRFYEAIVLEPEDGGVAMRFKHLAPGPGLRSWETQDEATEFVLTEHREGHAVFAQGEETWLLYDVEGDRLTVAFDSAVGKPPVKNPFLFERAPGTKKPTGLHA